MEEEIKWGNSVQTVHAQATEDKGPDGQAVCRERMKRRCRQGYVCKVNTMRKGENCHPFMGEDVDLTMGINWQ